MSDKLSGVHPVLAAKALKIIELAKADGIELRVVQGFRSFAEQDALFRQRPKVTNARGGQSNHNYGLAVDFGVFVAGKYQTDAKHYTCVGKYANAVGLEWGGSWTHFKDLPHVQFRGLEKPSVYQNILAKKGLADVWLRFK